ncbi:MAG: hypothetical protein GVY28_09700, partial [Alphaproteobacteria bacterium]|nr:hypothetical protein [Alphaproteobacteria bacterium]
MADFVALRDHRPAAAPRVTTRALGALLVAAAAWIGATGTAAAAATEWQSVPLSDTAAVEARLITAVDGPGALDAIPAGLEVRLPDDWKTYWRSPGDAGLPPELDWSGSINLVGTTIDYPAPHRFRLFGLETFGYGEQVVFPLTLTPAVDGAAMDLRLSADLLVCSDICVPASFDFALALPQGPATPDADAANAIARWAAQVPDDGSAAGLSVETVAADPEAPAGALVVEATAREPFVDPDILIEAGGWWMFGPPEATVGSDGTRLVARIPATQTPSDPGPLTDETVTVTV